MGFQAGISAGESDQRSAIRHLNRPGRRIGVAAIARGTARLGDS
jgi:hypothetical protein